MAFQDELEFMPPHPPPRKPTRAPRRRREDDEVVWTRLTGSTRKPLCEDCVAESMTAGVWHPCRIAVVRRRQGESNMRLLCVDHAQSRRAAEGRSPYRFRHTA